MPPPTDTDPELTVAAAYAIQRRNVDRRAGRGVRRSGYKVGLTSPRLQRRFDTDEPDFRASPVRCVPARGDGHLLGALRGPRVEPEVAFVLAAPLRGRGGVTAVDLLPETAFVVPALEVVDSRIAGPPGLRTPSRTTRRRGGGRRRATAAADGRGRAVARGHGALRGRDRGDVLTLEGRAAVHGCREDQRAARDRADAGGSGHGASLHPRSPVWWLTGPRSAPYVRAPFGTLQIQCASCVLLRLCSRRAANGTTWSRLAPRGSGQRRAWSTGSRAQQGLDLPTLGAPVNHIVDRHHGSAAQEYVMPCALRSASRSRCAGGRRSFSPVPPGRR